MRLIITAAILGGLILGAAACQSATVRGEQGRSLTATTARSMTLRRGTSAPLQVGIDREKFTGAVTVAIFQLPRGVSSDTSSIDSETTSATFILSATRSADLVSNQAVGVSVTGPDGRSATQFVNFTVSD